MGKLSRLKKDFEKTAVLFSSLLLFGYAIHWLGPYYFFFDLFSHFLNQYMIGGVILGAAFLFLKKWKWSALCCAIALLSFAEGRSALDNPYAFAPPGEESALKVMSFNHFINQNDYEGIEHWIRNDGQNIDVIALLEAQKQKTTKLGEHLSDLYPYQIHEARSGSAGQVILSKHPFENKQLIPFNAFPYWGSFTSKISIKKLTMQRPVALYVMHPPTPTSTERWNQRNAEMEIIARQARSLENSHVIVMGDFNNTPFTRSFHDFLQISDLNYQSYGLLQNPTWPSPFGLPIFQIPIDHVFYSDSLIQQNKYIGPALGSDHHAIIAEFSERQE